VNYESLWVLDNLPLTELMGPYDPSLEGIDQKLNIDLKTGHVFLENILPTEFLYNSSDYSYRTTSSPKTQYTLQRYLDFFQSSSKESKTSKIIDIGGNDLTLAKLLKPFSDECYVIDPVCSSIDGEEVEGIKVIGKKIEDVDLKEINPDIISCRHTIEHIEKPKEFINQLFDQCPNHCTFVFELPDFDCLVEGMRFDAVFHQHLHYFSIDTISNMVMDCGGEILNHEYNHQGSCGGALFIAFRKATAKQDQISINVTEKVSHLKKRIKAFDIHMKELSHQIEDLPGPVYGFGAGLMLATYAYHLETDFSFLRELLDDDMKKRGLGYKNLPLTIEHPDKVNIPEDSSFIITSMENIRPIYKRLEEFHPRRILIPNIS
tara:strand:- start:841 stop:1968 length:1128 start_codon:yes stop_codon:yes gene_type:complete